MIARPRLFSSRVLDDRLPVAVLAAAVVILGLWFSTMSASGSDSWGYVSEADLPRAK